MNKQWMRCWLVLVWLTGLLLGNVLPGFAQSQPPTGGEKQPAVQLSGDTNTDESTPFAPGEILVGFHRDQVRAASLLTDLDVQFADAVDLARAGRRRR